MQIENDYDKEVYNGDIGYIDDVDPDDGELIASFDGRAVTYGFGELDTLVPAYAATIHKSQGSEYPAVVIPGHDAALRHAAAEPALHRRHPRQAAGRAGRPAKGRGDRREECFGPTALDQALGMAHWWCGKSRKAVTSGGPLLQQKLAFRCRNQMSRASTVRLCMS